MRLSHHEKKPVGKSELAIVIRQFRDDAGFTQAQLASKIGTDQRVISRWETGKQLITMANLESLASALGLLPDKRKKLLLARLPALNPAWIIQQSKSEHAGLVAHAIRQVFHKHTHDLALELHMRVGDLVAVDNKHEPIDKDIEEKLERVFTDKTSNFWRLQFDGSLAEYFAKACEQSRNPEHTTTHYSEIEFLAPAHHHNRNDTPDPVLKASEFELTFDTARPPKFTR